MQQKDLTVLYERVSTDYQWVEAQQLALAKYREAHPGEKYLELHEVVSGRKMTGEKLQKLREMIRSGKVKRVVVYSWNRLGRNLLECLRLIQEMQERGVALHSESEPYDVNTPEGRLMFSNIIAFSEYFLGQLSRGTKMGLERAKVTCAVCGQHKAKHTGKEDHTFSPRFWGGVRKGAKWIAAKTLPKIPEILRLADAKFSIRRISEMLKIDQRTISRIVKERDSLPTVRERVWDQ